MIVVDTSAILAIVFREVRAGECERALAASQRLIVSAATLAEMRIVAVGRNRLSALESFLSTLALEVIPVDSATAEAVGGAFARWGKGMHPARLNFGDCFAYVLAEERGSPLLFIGNDFSQTDLAAALP
jgi:ribonuclease VapC